MSRPDEYLARALRDTGMLELRHQCGDRWVSGLFNDLDALRQEVRQRSGQGNLYASLNVPRSLRASNAMGDRPLGNDDFTHIARLVFDFDPVRPKGVPSTDAEMLLAIQARDRMVAALQGLGFPEPATAESGNGAHALFRCRLPITGETGEMLGALYRGAKLDFGLPGVEFDAVVRNAGRIWRLYGTVNRKGPSTIERPHRLAVIRIPSRWEAVSLQQIERLATGYAHSHEQHRRAQPRREPMRVGGAGDYRTLDVVGWFAAHGLHKRHLGGGKHAVTCPWAHEHSTPDDRLGTDTVVWQTDGQNWPSFHCLHGHCDGRGIREVMEVLGDADEFCGRAWKRSA